MRKGSWTVILCGAGLYGAGAPARLDASFSGLVFFGDSLSDVGNVYNQTFGLSPQSPPYYQGRYSNGPLWNERLAADLSLPAPTPSRLGGRDYAFGGTKTGSGSTIYFPFAFPNIGTQVNNYLGGGNTPAPDQLFVVWGGGNDFIDGQSNPQVPVDNIRAHVTALASAGARQFLVPNLPPLGEVPRFRGTPDQATMNARSAQFNDLLAPALDGLESSLGVQIFQLDIEGLFHDMLANPAAYGFTNTTGTALVGNTPAPNQDEYVFWDDIHPTRVAHGLIGAEAARLSVTHTWVSAQPGGNWTTAANWDPAGVPAPDWIAHVVNDNIPSAQAVAVGQNSSVQHVLVRGGTGAMTLIVQSVAELSAASISIEQQGRISLQGGTINTPTLDVGAGGALAGTGVVAGDVTSAGVVSPGEPGSTLRIDGSFTQTPTGRIEIGLAGTGSGLHDVLEVEGAATLAGALAVRLQDSFVALPGQSFLALTFASRAGDVTLVNETGYAGLTFDTLYTPTSLTLAADALLDGDANLDARVNLADFNILAANFGASGADWLRGDFTGDGVVNLSDFNVLAAAFGLGAGPGAAPSPGDWASLAASVPEPGGPATAAAALAGVAGAAGARRRRSSGCRPRTISPEVV